MFVYLKNKLHFQPIFSFNGDPEWFMSFSSPPGKLSPRSLLRDKRQIGKILCDSYRGGRLSWHPPRVWHSMGCKHFTGWRGQFTTQREYVPSLCCVNTCCWKVHVLGLLPKDLAPRLAKTPGAHLRGGLKRGAVSLFRGREGISFGLHLKEGSA